MGNTLGFRITFLMEYASQVALLQAKFAHFPIVPISLIADSSTPWTEEKREPVVPSAQLSTVLLWLLGVVWGLHARPCYDGSVLCAPLQNLPFFGFQVLKCT